LTTDIVAADTDKPAMNASAFVETALQAAEAAEEVIRRYYRKHLEVTVKSDRTPVTEADIAAEYAIREVLGSRFPEHGFYGEETGRDREDSPYLWLVDPIDGTKSFIRGYPFFSTQIALMHEGKIIAAVSNAPAFQERAWAERGVGAWLDDEKIQVSHINRLEDATLSSGNLRSLAESPLWDSYGSLVAGVSRVRGYGDFYHYHLLAAGRIDVVIESDVNILDIAALSLIVEEAGGRFTNLDGAPIGLETTSVLATNNFLHDVVMERL
jgi:histidinol-phosphatase